MTTNPLQRFESILANHYQIASTAVIRATSQQIVVTTSHERTRNLIETLARTRGVFVMSSQGFDGMFRVTIKES